MFFENQNVLSDKKVFSANLGNKPDKSISIYICLNIIKWDRSECSGHHISFEACEMYLMYMMTEVRTNIIHGFRQRFCASVLCKVLSCAFLHKMIVYSFIKLYTCSWLNDPALTYKTPMCDTVYHASFQYCRLIQQVFWNCSWLRPFWRKTFVLMLRGNNQLLIYLLMTFLVLIKYYASPAHSEIKS